MKITVVGAGYVGLSNAALLARQHAVTVLDTNGGKVAALKQGSLPIVDADIEQQLAAGNLDLSFTTSEREAYGGAGLVIVATPTDYDPVIGSFNTASVEAVLQSAVAMCPGVPLLIKSTVPVGFTEQARLRYGCPKIVFSPEFLREGHALHDNLYPSRIVIGDRTTLGSWLAGLFVQVAEKKDVPVVLTGSTEAEAIKLFANTYLAMRVSYFNELDTFSAVHGLDAREIIDGVCLDARIGSHYNNPSFGYGGYCLPKDTRQMLANYQNVPQNLVRAIVDSNQTRKEYIARTIIQHKPHCVGVYRLVMKAGSNNFRSSSVLDIVQLLVEKGVQVVAYEPVLAHEHTPEIPEFLSGVVVENNLAAFKQRADLIIANRLSAELDDVMHKVYSRDLFNGDL